MHHGDRNILTNGHRSTNVHGNHSRSVDALTLQDTTQLNNSLGVNGSPMSHDELRLLMHLHNLHSASDVISVSMGNQDEIHVQTLLRHSFRGL